MMSRSRPVSQRGPVMPPQTRIHFTFTDAWKISDSLECQTLLNIWRATKQCYLAERTLRGSWYKTTKKLELQTGARALKI